MFFLLWALLNFLTTGYFLYEACLSIACFFRRKPLKEPDRYHRFAAVIAARNEREVIGNLIDSLRRQNYPPELIDVIVVADNCDDDTALVAEKAGAVVYRRFNRAEVGKCFVLRFAFDKIFEERDFYDAVCVFDADNVVHPDFFTEMNRALCAGVQVAQGYRDMKNPVDTWVSGGHSVFYWLENRFYNASRSFLGLSATINGTGFMATTALLKRQGWTASTLTEDLEFTMQCTLAGERVAYVPEAVVYDEQPLSLSQSMRQRIRWTNGYIQCFFKYFPKFVRRLANKLDWVTADMFLFLSFFPSMVFGIAAAFLYAVMVLVRFIPPTGLWMNFVYIGAGAVAGFWAAAAAAVFLEKKGLRRNWKAILTYPLFNLSWIAIYVLCIFRRSGEWKPIRHMRSISIKEMQANK